MCGGFVMRGVVVQEKSVAVRESDSCEPEQKNGILKVILFIREGVYVGKNEAF